MFHARWTWLGSVALALCFCALVTAGCGKMEAPRVAEEKKVATDAAPKLAPASEAPALAVPDPAAAAKSMAVLGMKIPLPVPPGAAPGPEPAVKAKSAEETAAPAKADKYKVELAADPVLKIPGIPGVLRVWIGGQDYQPRFGSGLTTDTGVLPPVGKWAKVTPLAPAFEVEPKEYKCMEIHPMGSEVRFKLKPLKEGIFDVGADVELFRLEDCRGTPVPRATASLKVRVIVDRQAVWKGYIQKLGEIFWQKLLDFWGAALAVLFAALLFLIRGKLKKWFGYKAEK